MKWLALFAFSVFAAIVYFANRGNLPAGIYFLYATPGGDKLGHLLISGILATFTNLCFSGRVLRVGARRILAGSLLTATILTLEEISQFFIPNRTFSLVDLAFNYAGIWLAGILFYRFQRTRPRRRGELASA